jgi:hypothetical protein
MGALVEQATGTIHVLEAHHLIGRSPRCSLRLPEASVSGEHASLRWTGRAWVVKDLGSRFGTFLNAAPLPPGVPTALEKGAHLAFGREKHVWVLVEDDPPVLMVVPEEGGPPLLSSDGMIAIPCPDNPIALVFQAKDGRWMLEHAGLVEPIEDHGRFAAASRHWRLCNASPLQLTSRVGDARETMSLDEAGLLFRVPRNEEYVELSARWRDRLVPLGTRSHHYLLLNLARIRLRHDAAGEPPARAGWVDQEELCTLLRSPPEKLNLDIFRARRQFAAEGFLPATAIVERRPAARELRIGVGELEIGDA